MTSFEPFAEEWDAFRKRPSSALHFFLLYAKGRVLDAGCGNGRNAIILAEKAKVWAVDVSEKMVKLAKKNLNKKAIAHKADLRQLPFQNKFFDAVLCLAVLHHFKPEEQAGVLQELRRVLKKNGFLCISVWNRHQKRFRNKPKELKVPWRLHERYYYFFDEDELRELLRKTGFRIVELFYEKKGAATERTEAQNLCVIAKPFYLR